MPLPRKVTVLIHGDPPDDVTQRVHLNISETPDEILVHERETGRLIAELHRRTRVGPRSFSDSAAPGWTGSINGKPLDGAPAHGKTAAMRKLVEAMQERFTAHLVFGRGQTPLTEHLAPRAAKRHYPLDATYDPATLKRGTSVERAVTPTLNGKAMVSPAPCCDRHAEFTRHLLRREADYHAEERARRADPLVYGIHRQCNQCQRPYRVEIIGPAEKPDHMVWHVAYDRYR